MDELHAVALEEIALEGKRGCAINLLWQLLQPRLPDGISTLTPHIKRHLWQLLLSEDSQLMFSTEQLMEQAREAAKEAGPAKKRRKKKPDEEDEQQQIMLQSTIIREAVPQDLEAAETAGIVMVASEAARMAVVGVYDESEAKNKLSEQQLGVLEMVGQGRHHGAVQTDMANALGVQHRNFFYVLKMLEARHMVVRNKLMVPMPSSSTNGNGWSLTSIVHLPRYAPQVTLGAEAVFKEVQTAQGQQLQLQQGPEQQKKNNPGSYVVRDDTTVMQQICDFLAAQPARYVSESQVKALLGFTGSAKAHRQWRRLRGRLVKVGCIAAEPGMLGDKAISVLRLIKPYKIEIPVVVDSDEDGDREAAGGDDEDGDGEDDEAAAEAEGAAAGGGGAKMLVEVGRDQLLLEAICEAGATGILTPELSRRLGVAPKVLLKAVPDLCKRFGVRVDYDMPNKALTNHIIAPPHLLEKHAHQQHLLLTASGQAPLLLAAPEGQQQQQGVQAAPAANAQPGTLDAAVTAPSGQQDQQLAVREAAEQQVAEEHATELAAMVEAHDGTSSAAAVAGDDTAAAAAAAPEEDAMDLDSVLDAAIAKHVLGTAATATNTAGDTAAPASAAEAMEVSADAQPETAAAPAQTASAAPASRPTAGRRLAGLSTQHPSHTNAAAYAGQAAGRTNVRTVPVTLPLSANAAAADFGPYTAPDQAAVAAAVARMPWLTMRGQGSLSRLQQRRLQVIMARLMEVGFVMKQELRRLILNGEQPPPQRTNLYEYNGPDSKTCNKLIALLVQQKAARLVKLQYKQEHVLDTKEVEVILRCDVEETQELLQRIAAYDQDLPGNLRRDGMRRALEAQGVAAAAAARLAAATAALEAAKAGGEQGAIANAEAIATAAAEAAAKESQLRVVDGELSLLPIGGLITRSLPGFGKRPGFPQPSKAKGRRRSKAKKDKDKDANAEDAAAAEAASSESDDEAAEETAAAEAAAPLEATAPSSAKAGRAASKKDATAAAAAEGALVPAAAAAKPTARSKMRGSKAQGGQDIMQMHRNGYIPSLMQRLKLLHQYLCTCVNLRVEPHEDIPPNNQNPPGSGGAQSATMQSAGHSEPDRANVKPRLKFQLANSELQQQPEQQSLLPRDSDAGYQGVFEFSRQMRKTDGAEGDTAADGATGDSAAAADAAGEGKGAATVAEETQQLAEVEQQLDGRLLSVNQMWLHMPLSLALQVAGSHLKITNLLELLAHPSSEPPPRLRDFGPEDLATVFGPKAWKRLLPALGTLSKLKLLTPARKGGDDGKTWGQSHPAHATHLIVGTKGILDVPSEFVDAEPIRLDFVFTDHGQWGEYWSKMQALYDNSLLSVNTLQRFFPASAVLDVARHRCWALSYRTLPLVPFLKLQARLEGLPVEQLDMHMARQMADELDQPYQAVQQFVTRVRTELNEAREKAGLERIYLLGKGDSGQLADKSKDLLRRQAQFKERQRRRAKQEKRRLRKQRKLQRRAEGLPSESSESESDVETEAGEGREAADWPLEETDGGDTAVAASRSRKKKRDKSKRKRSSSAQLGADGDDAEGHKTGSGDSGSSSNSEFTTDEELQEARRNKRAAAAAAIGGRMLPKIIFQLAPEDRPEAIAAAEAAASDSWDSDGDRVQPSRPRRDSGVGTDGVTTDAAGADSDANDGAVPARIANKQRRHRWMPQQDRQLLRWVVAQRIELGTRGQVRWSNPAPGLPLNVTMCTRRFNFLKKNRSSSLFLASLEAQATEIHKEFSARRTVLQQQLSRLQQESRLSVNPLLLQRQLGPPTAEAQKQQQEQEQQQVDSTAGAVADTPAASAKGTQQVLELVPLCAQQNAAAAADGTVPAASASLAVGGPHQVTPQGNIILLPDQSIQDKLDRLLEQIEEFTTPRYRPMSTKKQRNLDVTDRDESLGRQLQRRQRRRRQQEAAAAGRPRGATSDEDDRDNESEGLLSSGESDEGQEDGWLLPGADGLRKPRRGGSRHVRPLRTMADRVARSAAMLAAAAAAAAAVIAQRRAAGEQLTADAEERERQQQLQAALKGGKRRRRSQQRKQQQGQQGRLSAISGPRDLIQSWKRHHKGVETRPAASKPATAAVGEDVLPSAAGEQTADAAAVDLAGPADAAAEASAMVVAAAPSWPYGRVPTLPVVTAMHLVTSLLHLVATEGSLPPDASLALLLRFSQAEVAAAFRWLRALGWLNSGAARRPFQLSTAWIKRLRGEAVLSDLLDRTPAAALALMKAGLVIDKGCTAQQAHKSTPPSAPTAIEPDKVDVSTIPAATAVAADSNVLSATVHVAGMLLSKQQLLEQHMKQQELRQQQQTAKEATAGKANDKSRKDEDNLQAGVQAAGGGMAEGQPQQQEEPAVERMDVDEPDQHESSQHPVQQAQEQQGGQSSSAMAEAGQVAQQTEAEAEPVEAAAAADGAQPSKPSPSSLSSCLAALHPNDAGDSNSFWVGMQPPSSVAATEDSNDAAKRSETPASTARSQPVPGALLLELVCSAAAGQLKLRLCPTVMRGRAGGRGEAAPLFNRVPALLVQAQALGSVMKDDEAALTAELQESSQEAEVGAVKRVEFAGDAAKHASNLQLVPTAAASQDLGEHGLLAYCGCAVAATGVIDNQRTADTDGMQGSASAASTVAASNGKKRPRNATSPAGEQQAVSGVLISAQQLQGCSRFLPLLVGKDTELRRQAEEACCNAAADALACTDAGMVVPTPTADTAECEQGIDSASCKRRKVTDTAYTTNASAAQQQPQCQAGCSSAAKPRPELMRSVLAAVRQAGTVGVSLADLHQQLIKAADSCSSEDHHAEQTAVSDDSIHVQPAAAISEKAAQSAVAVSKLPQALLGHSKADGAVAASLALLRRYGLVRKVAGWQQDMWVSAEDSRRLLAWPVPEQPQQQQHDKRTESAAEAYPAEPSMANAASAPSVGDSADKAVAAVPPAAVSSAGKEQGTEQQYAGTSSTVEHKQQTQHVAGEVLVDPWLDHKGRLNHGMWCSLVKRVVSLVLRNPGIPEPLLLAQLDVISPAAAKKLLSILAQQQHLVTRQLACSIRLMGAGMVADNHAATATASSVFGHGPALQLGAALTGCAAAPAEPPFLLTKGSSTPSGLQSASAAMSQQTVLHYWPSLVSSTTCHLTCLPDTADGSTPSSSAT